jgi:hypothetical protein
LIFFFVGKGRERGEIENENWKGKRGVCEGKKVGKIIIVDGNKNEKIDGNRWKGKGRRVLNTRGGFFFFD